MTGTGLTVTVLGSGTGVPSLDRCAAGYLVETVGQTALLDCGPGVVRQVLSAGRDVTDIEAVFVTHTHPDHVADLVPLFHALNLLDQPRDEPLRLYGPSGIAEFVEQRVIPVSYPPQAFELSMEEVSDQFHWGEVLVTVEETVHTERLPSLAFRFEAGGRSVVFSGDGEDSPGLRSLAAAADLLVLDCSFPNRRKVPGHMSAGECGRLAHAAGAQRVLLSHLYPTAPADGDRVTECRAHFSGEVLLAEDLMVLEV